MAAPKISPFFVMAEEDLLVLICVVCIFHSRKLAFKYLVSDLIFKTNIQNKTLLQINTVAGAVLEFRQLPSLGSK